MKYISTILVGLILAISLDGLANCNAKCQDPPITFTPQELVEAQRACMEACFNQCVQVTHVIYYQCLDATGDGRVCQEAYQTYFKVCLVSEAGLIDHLWMI